MDDPSNCVDLDSRLTVKNRAVSLNVENVLVHREWLLTVLVTRLRNCRDVAEDLFGNLVAELVADKHDLSQVLALEPWLYRLTVNKANDWLRSERRSKLARERLAFVQEQTFSALDQPLPLDVILKDERSHLLNQALDSLDVEDAEILNLKYLHDWSYAQLEKHLGLSQHQITHRLRLARQRLKQILVQIQDASQWDS
jgi:RNA polymerase sigma factor (sigma-70 family)